MDKSILNSLIFFMVYSIFALIILSIFEAPIFLLLPIMLIGELIVLVWTVYALVKEIKTKRKLKRENNPPKIQDELIGFRNLFSEQNSGGLEQ